MKQIPYHKPYFPEQAMEYVRQSIASGRVCGDGPFTLRAQSMLEQMTGSRKVLLTPSCSSALEMAAMLIDLKPGDEVIMPSYTFVSTANAVLLRGATPVFADVCPDTMNIDPKEIEKRITSKTRAIFPVHYAGVACQMDEIIQIAEAYNLYVVEDAAQGVNSFYKGKPLGSIGHIGCYSFHETKNFNCGEGGAILINSEDEAVLERAEIIREKGTNRKQFFRGQVDKYSWVDIGSSYLMSDILAAVLVGQLEQLSEITELRKLPFQHYYHAFQTCEKSGRIRLMDLPEHSRTNYHIFYFMAENSGERERILSELRAQNIMASFHYVPLHLSTMGKHLGYEKGMLPITEELWERLVRLPLYSGMTEETIQTVVKTVKTVLGQ